jgi:hypothetical protein
MYTVERIHKIINADGTFRLTNLGSLVYVSGPSFKSSKIVIMYKHHGRTLLNFRDKLDAKNQNHNHDPNYPNVQC